MRIREVTAHAFGPLVGATLEFADGLTVVHGPNESGKSSWHAAVQAALCGRRRGKGKPDADEQEFIRRHRPWDRPDWLVSARIVLDDGRHVELRQDLDGRVACDAVDLELGRDVSAEIMHDGTPDAARWLGLDRTSFRATASVAQAQILDVLSRATGLQDQLQRAATTAGADRTARAALDLVERFHREVVGTDRMPAKPLRQSAGAVTAAEAALARATQDHAELERRLGELATLREQAERAGAAVARHEWAEAVRTAREDRTRADDVRAVAAWLAARPEPVPADADRTAAVAAALLRWAGVAESTALPTPRPAPTTAPEPRLTAGAGPGSGTGGLATIVAAGPTVDVLLGLATELEAPVPVVGPQPRQALDEAVRARAAALGSARTAKVQLTAGVVAFVLAVAAAVALVAVGPSTAGLAGAGVLALAGAALAGLGLTRRSAVAGRIRTAESTVDSARVELAVREREEASARARHDAAVARCDAADLPANPAALRELARHRTEREELRRRDEHWQDATFREAAEAVLTAAAAVGIDQDAPEPAAGALREWQRRQQELAEERTEWRRQTARLEAMLRGETVDAVVARADAATERADRLGAPWAGTGDPTSTPSPADPTSTPSTVDQLTAERAQAAAADQARHVAEVALAEWSAGLRPVGEAEEAVARARAERDRLAALADTLDLTSRFLRQAQERAHRTIAPVLADTVRRWLPGTTGGRYTEVTVDPEHLRVQVRGPAGRWRDADVLSYGTAEQIYLMLRIALAQHLASPGVSCPLLLDDVTVHADAERTAALLELLRRASEEDDRQIILFTQQEQVRQWASTLDGPRHALRTLPPVTAV